MDRPYFVFEVTPQCNNNCLYCYNVWKDNPRYPQGELALADIDRLLKKLRKDTDPAGVTLTGGEPLVRSDIADIAQLFHNHHIKVGLATNGTLLTKNKIAQLINAGVNYFEISLSAADEKTYGSLSQNNQAAKVRQAILLIKQQHMPLTVSITLTKLNIAHIEKIIDMCFAFSADVIALNRFVPGGRGLRNIEKLQISQRELAAALEIAERKSAANGIPINITIPIEACEFPHAQYPHLNFGACVCGKTKWAIDPLGNLRTCEQNPEILGNLFENDFSELSRTFQANAFRQESAFPTCSSCQQFPSCGGGCRFVYRQRTRTTPNKNSTVLQ